MSAEQVYCGCCGNEIGQSTRSDPDWCARCRSHVLPYRREVTGCRTPACELTWFAQTGEDCPFQVGAA